MVTRIVEPLLVDTNVLLEATDENREHHAVARRLIESRRQLTVAAQVIREYLVVATRPPAANGLGMTTVEALENVREFRVRLRLLPEEKPILPTLLTLLVEVPCNGKRIHDAHLIATAMVHKVRTLVTLNLDDVAPFVRHVAAISPLQALQDRRRARGIKA